MPFSIYNQVHWWDFAGLHVLNSSSMSLCLSVCSMPCFLFLLFVTSLSSKNYYLKLLFRIFLLNNSIFYDLLAFSALQAPLWTLHSCLKAAPNFYLLSFFLASILSYLLFPFTVLPSINSFFCVLVSLFCTVASESTVMAASLRMTPNSNSTRSSQPNIKMAGSRTSNNLNSTSALDSKKKVYLKKHFCHWLSCNLRERCDVLHNLSHPNMLCW